MSTSLKVALINPIERSEIIFTIAHHRASHLRVLFATQQQSIFYNDALINTHYTNINFQTFQTYTLNQQPSKNEIVIIADVPVKLQILQQLIKKIGQNGSQPILILLKYNKKYINFIQKKINIKVELMQFSSNKFVGINDKLRQFVQSNYNLNRAGFFAYGSYLNYFRNNLIKKIFRTDQINVADLARGFGFTTPPRVRDGKFMTEKARKQTKILRKQKKILSNIEKKKIVKEKSQREDQTEQNKEQKQDNNPQNKSNTKKSNKKYVQNIEKTTKTSKIPQKTKQILKKIPRIK